MIAEGFSFFLIYLGFKNYLISFGNFVVMQQILFIKYND